MPDKITDRSISNSGNGKKGNTGEKKTPMTEALEQVLQEIPEELLKDVVRRIDAMELPGPTISEYLSMKKHYLGGLKAQELLK